jgi:AraC-like DNA-binding protein
VFGFDEWDPGSSYVGRCWQTRSQPEPAFISVATSSWKMVVVTRRGTTQVVVRGPETRATTVPIPDDAEFFGIDFSLGTFMPCLPLPGLVDQAVTLPDASPGGVWIGTDRWETPRSANADVFVERLVRRGVVVRDPVAVAALAGRVAGYATRTLERRVARATGLTRGTIRQIARAEQAVEALAGGVPPAEAAPLLGYADQAHLNRSLRRFVGETPAQVAGPTGVG